MALDVHLTRGTNEKWGFEIVGGADEDIPITIVKMESPSPASRAGLQSGDMIFTINGEEAIDFTHEEACRKVAECADILTVGVMRGLYDPVLDDQDPILYEPGDLDPESQPTEVSFKIQQFIEPADLGSTLIDYGDTNTPLSTLYDPSILLAESRSLTASPFVNPTKPYRPFSTEPLPEVPPLEDPIILNPNFKDQFGKNPIDVDPDYILNAHYKNNGFESKFKLPISEQYNPDGTKCVKNVEIDSVLSKYTKMEMLCKKSQNTDEKITKTTISNMKTAEDSKQVSITKDLNSKESFSSNIKEASSLLATEQQSIKEENFKNNAEMSVKRDLITQNVEEKIITEELKYIENMKHEMDIDQIERTAHSVVEDSIERAVSIAENIEKEMKVDLNLDVEEKSGNIIKEAEKKIPTLKNEKQMKEVLESSEIKETDFEVIDKIASNKEHLKYIEEDVQNEQSNTEDHNRPERVYGKDEKETLETNFERFKKVTQTNSAETNSDKSGAQQRIYEIGLQTIPNIRGVVHSSYHYDLLLRTFFIHLTDVMVALSRFLLTQPVFNNSCHQTRETVNESHIKRDARDVTKTQQEVVESSKTVKHYDARTRVDLQHEQIVEKKVEIPVQEKLVHKRELVTPISIIESKEDLATVTKKQVHVKTDLKQVKTTQKSDIKQEQMEADPVGIIQVEEKKISGAQMAQRTEKKLTKDMTQKMDAVISEFQTIAVEEDKKEMLQRSRRSRSRSQIEEEVAKESDPLEWLDKVDSRRASQEVSEERLSQKEYSSSETFEKRCHKKLEKQEIKHKKANTPKQMYVAVVEAHVYTNKDVIFEDAAEFSETSSVQSAEEVNTAFEAMEAMQSENLLLESAVQQIEQAKIVEETQDLSRMTAQSEGTVHQIEEIIHESKTLQEEKYQKETAKQSTDIQDVVIQETKQVIEPVVEMKEIIKKENLSVDINESLYIAESSEVNVNESKSEYNNIETKEDSVAVVVEDYRECAVVQPVVEVKEAKQEIVDVKTEVESQVQIEDTTDNVVVKAEKPAIIKEEEYATLKIVKEIDTKEVASPDIIEIEEEEVNKIQMSKELQLDGSIVFIEKSKLSSEHEISMESQSKMTSEADISTTLNHISMERYQSETYMPENNVQELSFTEKNVDKKLTVRTDLKTQESLESEPSIIDTPTPSAVPPTPLTDEYVFKLTIPLPKSRSATPVPRDCSLSPKDEDPHIVKKKLIPHIETTIERVVYDPPLPTPPTECPLTPIFKTPGLFGGSSKPIYKIKFPMVYRKPGLFGGADNLQFGKEEIREIERKSSLLASAIDETIKSIEEYKEEVGIETKKEVKVTEFTKETSLKSNQESYSEDSVIEAKENSVEEPKTAIKEKSETATDNIETSIAIITEQEITEKKGTDIQNQIFETEPVKEIEVKIEQETKPEEIIKERIKVERTANITEAKENGIKNSDISMDIIDVAQNNVPENKEKVIEIKLVEEEIKKDPMAGFRPVVFDPESMQKRSFPHFLVQEPTTEETRGSPYVTDSGEIIGTVQGIVDGLEEPVMDPELAKELGKPGISEEKIAELISGEAEMLREAHVMGLSRVLNSHMHRTDDSSVDFQKIKPMIGSLKDSEVLKALNEELARQKEAEKKKEEKRWTTFLQKPKRPSPKATFGYHGWTDAEQAIIEEPYKVKIVKQAKPKVAPDYKPEDFETGPLPWEQRAEVEASLPPVEPEEPILVPELPEYLEAVDPLPESEVPDLIDTGLPLPPPREPTPPPVIKQIPEDEEALIEQEAEVEQVQETIEEEEQETKEDMENKLSEQLVRSVQSMVDPNAPVEQQLLQMRAQLAALAQLPEVIQQTLELVSKQLNKMGQQETRVEVSSSHSESHQEMEVIQNHVSESVQEQQAVQNSEQSEIIQNGNTAYENDGDQVKVGEMQEINELQEMNGLTKECKRVQTPQIPEEEIRSEKMQKVQRHQLEADGRQIKQRSTPRVGKPTRMFGPLDPDSRPVVLPGGRRWRKASDVYNEQLIAETISAQSELLNGKTMGFESYLLPFDDRINFMKYEKPPVSLDHLQNSETYKLVHDMNQPPVKKVEMLRPVISEADYRERCRSATPSGAMKHIQIPQQFHP